MYRNDFLAILSSPLPTLFYPWQVSPCSGHPTFKFHEDGDSNILETAYVNTTIIYKQNSHMCVHNSVPSVLHVWLA